MFKIKISADEATNKAINSKYYTYRIDVIPPEPGAELLPAELVDEFKESFLEIAKLREDQLNYHKNLLENKEAEAKDAPAAAFGDMGETIADSIGLGSGSEDVPF
jgi:hypothetical protein